MDKSKKTVIFGTLAAIVIIVAVVSLLNRSTKSALPDAPVEAVTTEEPAAVGDVDTLYIGEPAEASAAAPADSSSPEEYILSMMGADTIRIDTANLVDYFAIEE